MTAKFKIKLVHENAKVPVKATDGSIGYDCFAVSETITKDYIEYDLGFVIIPEDGYYAEIYARSSVTKKNIFLKNCVGIIDSDYRDTVKARFATPEGLGIFSGTQIINEGDKEDVREFALITFPYEEDEFSDIPGMPIFQKYNVGDRVCQLIVRQKFNAEFELVDDIDETSRKGGFGSTNI